MGNPYSLVFGKEPAQLVSRVANIKEVTTTFGAENPTQQAFLITGVRGSGKTVLMTEICKNLRKDDKWIVVELNPERDMLEALASKLSSENNLARIFKSAKINLSFFGFGLSVSDAAPITDIEVALAKMLGSLKRHGKRVLVAVDEVASTANVRTFASAFQILVRQNLPIFLLMTGLFANVRKLQDEKTLTFLYRAPRIQVGPLNIGAVADSFRKSFRNSNRRSTWPGSPRAIRSPSRCSATSPGNTRGWTKLRWLTSSNTSTTTLTRKSGRSSRKTTASSPTALRDRKTAGSRTCAELSGGKRTSSTPTATGLQNRGS